MTRPLTTNKASSDILSIVYTCLTAIIQAFRIHVVKVSTVEICATRQSEGTEVSTLESAAIVLGRSVTGRTGRERICRHRRGGVAQGNSAKIAEL